MKIEKSLAHRIIDGQAFVMDPAHKKLHSLNPSATTIWKGLAAGKKAEAIAAELVEEFDVSESKARSDVIAFVEQLKHLHLLA